MIESGNELHSDGLQMRLEMENLRTEIHTVNKQTINLLTRNIGIMVTTLTIAV